jgi:hypothetical protein
LIKPAHLIPHHVTVWCSQPVRVTTCYGSSRLSDKAHMWHAYSIFRAVLPPRCPDGRLRLHSVCAPHAGARAFSNVNNIEKRGKGQRPPVPLIWIPSRSWEKEEEEIIRRGGRWNTRFTFETSRYNTCNIRLKTDETLETCI